MSRLLVCPPEYFQIDYEINPWMRGNERGAGSARGQPMAGVDDGCSSRMSARGLQRMHPVEGLPDLVFTANAGVVVGRRALVSRFRYPERQREEVYFARWFRGQGYEVLTLEKTHYFRRSRRPVGISGYLVRRISSANRHPIVPDLKRTLSA
jgi:N-dimethylarginine dimethylaminohydrolase